VATLPSSLRYSFSMLDRYSFANYFIGNSTLLKSTLMGLLTNEDKNSMRHHTKRVDPSLIASSRIIEFT